MKEFPRTSGWSSASRQHGAMAGAGQSFAQALSPCSVLQDSSSALVGPLSFGVWVRGSASRPLGPVGPPPGRRRLFANLSLARPFREWSWSLFQSSEDRYQRMALCGLPHVLTGVLSRPPSSHQPRDRSAARRRLRRPRLLRWPACGLLGPESARPCAHDGLATTDSPSPGSAGGEHQPWQVRATRPSRAPRAPCRRRFAALSAGQQRRDLAGRSTRFLASLISDPPQRPHPGRDRPPPPPPAKSSPQVELQDRPTSAYGRVCARNWPGDPRRRPKHLRPSSQTAPPWASCPLAPSPEWSAAASSGLDPAFRDAARSGSLPPY